MIGNGLWLFESVSQIFMFYNVKTHIERFILIVKVYKIVLFCYFIIDLIISEINFTI